MRRKDVQPIGLDDAKKLMRNEKLVNKDHNLEANNMFLIGNGMLSTERCKQDLLNKRDSVTQKDHRLWFHLIKT